MATDMRDRLEKDRVGMMSMWLNWVIAAGVYILLFILALIIPKVSYPFFVAAVALALFIGMRANRASRRDMCFLMPFVTMRTLYISALIMLMINFMHRGHVIDLVVSDVNLINPHIPYISALILAPVATVMSLWALIRGDRMSFCADCIRINGSSSERGYLGAYFSREARYQLKFMAVMSGLYSVVVWGYYYLYYINVNLNSPDIFMFIVAPVLLLILTIVYMGVRYLGLWQYYQQNLVGNKVFFGRTTNVRFLILCGGRMLLKVPDISNLGGDFDEMFVDTPVSLSVRRKTEVSDEQAREYFVDITNVEDFNMRFLYSNEALTADNTVYHYLVDLPSPDFPEGARLNGEWFTMSEVEQMLNAQALSPMLRGEIIRIHTVMMAWKKYDREGFRRNAIKQYTPSFDIRDVVSANLDFNDPIWLYVAYNNQDSRFFRIRKFFDRYMRGTYGGK